MDRSAGVALEMAEGTVAEHGVLDQSSLCTLGKPLDCRPADCR
ncbi:MULTISPECIES: hypothetical protein [unclassified Rhodococcus (in: high G+C Gram-positive bacteria)]|nr:MULTISPECIES: hypothetical protein [unclassified Rhodococcus (in: high G+C Gram-positive bacteria)]